MISNYFSSLRRVLIQTYQRISIITAIFCVVLIFLIYGVSNYIHVQTYSWQCTTLGASINPVARETCDFAEPTTSQQKLKIGILMMYNNKNGGWDNDLMDRVLKNREKYSQMHGYTMINKQSNRQVTASSME